MNANRQVLSGAIPRRWAAAGLRLATPAVAALAATWLPAPAAVADPADRMVLNTTSSSPDVQPYHARAREGHSKHDFSPRRPPRKGRFIYGHWTPYSPPDPKSYPPSAVTHVVVKGDTLWSIATQSYQDPYLWPYLWEANPWVTYPHWIYPGDTLLVPPLTVIPGGALEETAKLDDILKGFYPAGGYDSVHCGHFIADPNRKFTGEVIEGAADPEPVMFTLNEVVYINVGAKDGVLPGDEFAIVYPPDHLDLSVTAQDHVRRQLLHPVSGQKLGYVMKMCGRLKVILLGDEVSTARITYACDAIEAGFDIYPFAEVPVPLVRRHERQSYFNEMSKRGRGFIVYAEDSVAASGNGALVSIDLGSEDGVIPGDTFRIFRPFPTNLSHENVDYLGDYADWRKGIHRMHRRRDPTEFGFFGREHRMYDTPPRVLGELVVLYTEAHTATARVLNADKDVTPGDSVVYVPVDTGVASVATYSPQVAPQSSQR